MQSQLSLTQDTDYRFAQLTEVLGKLRAFDSDLAPDGLTTAIFIATDQEVVTSIQSLPSDEEQLHQPKIVNTSNDDVEIIVDESDEMESAEKKQPSEKALFKLTDLIESF